MSFLWKDRTDQEIEVFIDKTAERIVSYGLVEPSILFFESIKPVAIIGGRLGGAAFAWLIPFIGFSLDDYFVVFREPRNVEKLLKLIEEKNEKKKVVEKEEKKPAREQRNRNWKFWKH